MLAGTPGIGPRTVNRLIAHFGDPRRVLAADRQALRAAGLRDRLAESLLSPNAGPVDASLRWAEQEGAFVLTWDDDRYPRFLRQLDDAPVALYVRGDPSVLSDPQLAVVGSRNPSPAGRDNTRELARHLASCGLVITSGLAIGADGAAHEGALEGGRTVAVLGTGPDRVYPASHRGLAKRIAAQGALVTEFPPGSQPRGENFPRRNRLISGLSVGTLVTEAALKSGSLITARYAMEQGREVFAIPGSIHNPLARGCHALIRDGAKLVETAQDVLEELVAVLGPFTRAAGVEAARGGPAAARDSHQPAARHRQESGDPVPASVEGANRGESDRDYRLLLEAMGHDPVAQDELIRRTGLPAQSVSSMLLLLELEGSVSSYPGGRYCRTGNSA
jgi:DNA processing protein